MNRVSMTLACAALVFAVQPAVASEDVSSELAEMRELMQGLQQKVDAQEEQLEHQGKLLEQAQGAVRTQQSDGSESGLSAFLDMINVGGHIAASYNYNFNTPHNRAPQPDNGPFSDTLASFDVNTGEDGVFLPFHRDHNSFTVDQIWFSISKEATEESRAGFGFDILYGQNANYLGQGGQVNNNGDLQSRRSHNLDGTSDYYVHQAYVEYLCDCLGPEIGFKFGKWWTVMGAEVAQSPANFNVTRGNVYSLLQPVDHLGLLATSDLGPLELSAGIMNSATSSISSPDFNKEKAYLASAKVGDERLNLRTTFHYGGEGFPGTSDDPNERRSGLVDVTAWFNPTDTLSMWVNYNYLYLEGSALYINGVATAARLAVTDTIGVALRGEYIREHVANSLPGDEDFTGILDDDQNQEVYSLTGTVDYALTDHLITRAEVRFDWIDSPGESGQGFFQNHDGNADNQTVGLLEVIYTY